jgi:hypothetical protein
MDESALLIYPYWISHGLVKILRIVLIKKGVYKTPSSANEKYPCSSECSNSKSIVERSAESVTQQQACKA